MKVQCSELRSNRLTWRVEQATLRTPDSEQDVILLNGEETEAVLHPSNFSSLSRASPVTINHSQSQ